MVVTLEATLVAVNKGRQSEVLSFKQPPPSLVELDVVEREQMTHEFPFFFVGCHSADEDHLWRSSGGNTHLWAPVWVGERQTSPRKCETWCGTQQLGNLWRQILKTERRQRQCCKSQRSSGADGTRFVSCENSLFVFFLFILLFLCLSWLSPWTAYL